VQFLGRQLTGLWGNVDNDRGNLLLCLALQNMTLLDGPLNYTKQCFATQLSEITVTKLNGNMNN